MTRHQLRTGFAISVAACVLAQAAIAQVAPVSLLPLQPSPSEPGCNEYVIQSTLSKNLTFLNRACLFRSKLVSPSGVFGALFFAGIGQAQNSPPEWGQGLKGYGRRVGTNLAQSTAKSTGEFLASYAFHEDPRLAPGGESQPYIANRWRRLGRALTAPVVIWGPHPRPRFGYIAGSAASGFVGMTWYPDNQAHVGDALIRTGTAFGGYVSYSVFSEFQPELFKWAGKLFGNK